MWPGSEAHVMGVEPTYLDEYNGKEALPNKVNRLFEFLDRPGFEDQTVAEREMRPQLVALYVPNVDSDGHRYGPNSTEIRLTIENADNMLDDIFKGLEQRNLTSIVNVIIVSDHGMATTDTNRLVQLEDLVDTSKIAHKDGWPLVGLRPKDDNDLAGMHRQILENTKDNPNVEVYLRDVDMPERYHFSKNERIAPLWIVPKTGWGVVAKEEFDVEKAKKDGTVYHPRGMHGYDHEHPLMRAIFVARGPAFPHPPNSQIDNFRQFTIFFCQIRRCMKSLLTCKCRKHRGLQHPLRLGGHDTPSQQRHPPATPQTARSPPTRRYARGTGRPGDLFNN